MIHLVVALGCEARPLVRRFGLERVDLEGPFAVYRGDYGGDPAILVVSGVGRAATAAAVGFLFGVGVGVAGAVAERRRPWLNVGIAGGSRFDDGSAARIGDARIAARVHDQASGRSHYPPLAFEPPVPLTTVTTVDRVERAYADAGLYDMEAAAFVEAARRLVSAELVQVLKVVSDTPEAPIGRLTAARIEELVEGRVDDVAEVVRSLTDLAQSGPPPLPESWTREALAGRHFSVTQRRQLRRLLERVRAAGLEPALGGDSAATASRLLAALEAQFDGAALVLEPRDGAAHRSDAGGRR